MEIQLPSPPMQRLIKLLTQTERDGRHVSIQTQDLNTSPTMPPPKSRANPYQQNGPRKMARSASMLSTHNLESGRLVDKSASSTGAEDEKDRCGQSVIPVVPKRQSRTAMRTARFAQLIAERAGGKEMLENLLTQLETAGLWLGSFRSEQNLRLLQKFFGMQKKVGKQYKNNFIQISTGTINWWVREGPLLTPVNDGGSNRKFAVKATQFQHFVDAVLQDRDEQSVEQFELSAKNLGYDPYSGRFVVLVVAEACRIQRISYPSTSVKAKGGDKIKLLSNASMLAAANTVLGPASTVSIADQVPILVRHSSPSVTRVSSAEMTSLSHTATPRKRKQPVEPDLEEPSAHQTWKVSRNKQAGVRVDATFAVSKKR